MTTGDNQGRLPGENTRGGQDYRSCGRGYRGRRRACRGDQAARQGDCKTRRMGGLGGFGALFDLKAAGFSDPVLVSTTDGVGTKLKIADRKPGCTIAWAIDLVAMCVNDLVSHGAEPLFFLDYFATGKLSVPQASVGHRRYSQGCHAGRLRPGWRRDGGNARHVCRGGLRPSRLRSWCGGAWPPAAPARSRPAIRSSAWPARAFIPTAFRSSARSCESLGLGWTDAAPFAPDQALAQALMTATRIYVRAVLALHRAGLLKAAAHITGGGLPGNLPRVLPEGTVAALTPTWPVPPVFNWLARAGRVENSEMVRVFNCGVGMALVVSDPDAAAAILEAEGETVSRIGEIETAGPYVPDRQTGQGAPSVRFDPPPGWLA